MLNFDLNQNPPTAEEIAAERQDVERKITRLKRRVWLGSVVTLMVAIPAMLAAWHFGWIDGEQAIGGTLVGTLVGTILVGTFAVVGVGALVGAVAVAFVVGGVFAVVGVFTVVGVFAVKNRIEGYIGQLSKLDNMLPDQCEQYVKDCISDPACENYRQKVANLSRKPVAAEVQMIRDWVESASTRESARLEEIACALVASREPLPVEALSALNADEGESC